jgi:hypothetical protein
VRSIGGKSEHFMLSIDSYVKARAQAAARGQGLTVSAYISRLVLRKKFTTVSLALTLSPLIELGHDLVRRLDNGPLSERDRELLVGLRSSIAGALQQAEAAERKGSS